MDNIQSEIIGQWPFEPKDLKVLSKAEAENLATTIRERFGNASATSDPLWETLNETEAYHGEEADIQLKQRLKNLGGPLRLLIDDWHGYSALEIPTGAQFGSLLESFYNFRWYATDLEMTFVLYTNDHDMVMFCNR